MPTTGKAAWLVLAAALTAGCGSPGGQAQNQADGITKAVYNNDATAATQNFDDSLKKQVTIAQVAMLSDKMHKLGDYSGLTYVSTDAVKNEYSYTANFSNGKAPVILRMDPDGKVAAYRISLPPQ